MEQFSDLELEIIIHALRRNYEAIPRESYDYRELLGGCLQVFEDEFEDRAL